MLIALKVDERHEDRPFQFVQPHRFRICYNASLEVLFRRNDEPTINRG
jgi:hypothetical protein